MVIRFPIEKTFRPISSMDDLPDVDHCPEFDHFLLETLGLAEKVVVPVRPALRIVR